MGTSYSTPPGGVKPGGVKPGGVKPSGVTTVTVPGDRYVKKPMDPVADLLGSGRIIAYQVELARAVGSVTAGLLLSQFWYCANLPTSKERDGWFYIGRDEITEQTCLSREEQETARRRLRSLGVIEEEKRGVPCRLWYRLDKSRLYELLRERANQLDVPVTGDGDQTIARRDMSRSAESPQPDGGKAPSQMAGKPPASWRDSRQLDGGKAANQIAGKPPAIPTVIQTTPKTTSKDYAESQSPSQSDPPGEGEGDPLTETWTAAMERLAPLVPMPTFKAHLCSLHLDALEPDPEDAEHGALVAHIAAPAPWSIQWLEKREHDVRIAAALAEVLGVPVRAHLALA